MEAGVVGWVEVGRVGGWSDGWVAGRLRGTEGGIHILGPPTGACIASVRVNRCTRCGETWENMGKHGKTWGNMGKHGETRGNIGNIGIRGETRGNVV